MTSVPQSGSKRASLSASGSGGCSAVVWARTKDSSRVHPKVQTSARPSAARSASSAVRSLGLQSDSSWVTSLTDTWTASSWGGRTRTRRDRRPRRSARRTLSPRTAARGPPPTSSLSRGCQSCASRDRCGTRRASDRASAAVSVTTSPSDNCSVRRSSSGSPSGSRSGTTLASASVRRSSSAIASAPPTVPASVRECHTLRANRS
mmetsp:Transcript_16891/g.68127  ORF Transcript_16891/g.68127 Transcript_16891/m.68127 type:complete len:205 (+) Transcript_16891:636-1250(+)